MFSKVCSQTSGQHCPRSLKNSSQDNEEPPPSDERRPCVNINTQEQSSHCCHNTGNTKQRLLCCQKKLWPSSKYQKKSRGTKNLIIYRKMPPKMISNHSKAVKSNHDILCSRHHCCSGRYEDVFWDNCNMNNHGERVNLVNRLPRKTTCKVNNNGSECMESGTYVPPKKLSFRLSFSLSDMTNGIRYNYGILLKVCRNSAYFTECRRLVKMPRKLLEYCRFKSAYFKSMPILNSAYHKVCRIKNRQYSKSMPICNSSYHSNWNSNGNWG